MRKKPDRNPSAATLQKERDLGDGSAEEGRRREGGRAPTAVRGGRRGTLRIIALEGATTGEHHVRGKGKERKRKGRDRHGGTICTITLRSDEVESQTSAGGQERV